MLLSKYFQIVNPTYRYLKIIPHTSIKNNKTSELASIVNSMYQSLNKRIVKENKKLIITSQCKLAYYIYITKDNVNFYFIVPEYYLGLIKTRINSTWGRKVNIEEVSEIPSFKDDCDKYQMCYKNKDGLSLAADRRNNDLLSSNLSIINTMNTGDAVGIIYNMMPLSEREQKTWITRYEEDYKTFIQNKNIEKINMSLKNIAKLALLFVIKNLSSFLEEIQMSLSKNEIKIGAFEQLASAVDDKRKLSKATISKKNDTIIKTQIAILSQSDDKLQQKKLLDSMANSFDVIKENNQLVPRKIKQKFNIEDYDFNISILNCSDKELNNGIAIPGRELLNEYNIEKNEVTESSLPDELKSGHIRLGENIYKDKSESAFFDDKSSLSNLPIALCGASRSGKSTFTENIAKDMIDNGESLIVFDFIKDTELSTNIKRVTPKDRVIDLDLCELECYQAFCYNELYPTNTMTDFQRVKCANKQTVQIMNLIDSINSNGLPLTGKMSRFLLSAGKIVFLNSNACLKDVIRCLQNYKYRMDLIDNLDDRYKVYLEEDIDNLLELNEYDKRDNTVVVGTRDSKIEGILDRINLLKRDPNMNLMYALSPKNNINFVKAMDEGKVIFIRLREDEFSDTVSKNVLCTFFITKIWQSILLRSKYNGGKCNVIIDELFQVPTAQKLIAKELVQSAKFNLKYVFTLHYLNQLSTDTQEALKSANASYCLISGCDKKAFKELEEEFVLNGYELEDLLKLKQYHSLNLIKTSNSYASFITKLPPPIN